MPRQNRVTPHGELIAVPDRGMFWGNRGARRTYQAPLAGLPTGTMVDISGSPWLVLDGQLLAWTPGGYRVRHAEAPGGPVTVITPRATAAVLAAGYQPVPHPSATAAAG